ncbi:universal stress protein [Mycobacterium sp. 2YAF39]|uniref:universal stress protein n=1 Tax=Mycobacterium sp. 2YAF39 TaxID=3233033 RepID=UPI003F95ECDF
MKNSKLPVVVGIDGSKHAVHAALWAVDEAVDRDVPILLVCVVNPHAEDLEREYAYARHALHEAWIAAEATGEVVKLESTILQGDAVEQLREASRLGQLICVGSRGIDDSPHHEHGSTAAALAQVASTPVVVVRRRHPHKPLTDPLWIVAAVDESPGGSAVLQAAIDEATLRKAPVLALTRWPSAMTTDSDDKRDVRTRLAQYLAEAQEDDAAGVQICALPISHHIAGVLAQSANIDQLVIVDAHDPVLTAEAVGPEARKALRHTNCSVLVLR